MFGLGEEEDYEATTHDISGSAFCERLAFIKKEELKKKKKKKEEEEEEAMHDDLSVWAELDSPELDVFESCFSALSPTVSSAPPKIPSPRNLSLLPISLPPAARCSLPSSSLGVSHRSLRLRPVPKAIPSSSKASQALKEPTKEDDILLLRWRSQGISYKTIKERLGIDEAESTLRGRLRTLTKPKNERVRRPQWMEKDVCLSTPNAGALLLLINRAPRLHCYSKAWTLTFRA